MNRLKELRALHGYTQDFVASHIGITRAAYTNVENGKRQIDTQTLLKLSALYGVSVGCLLGVEPLNVASEIQPAPGGDELDRQLVSLLTDLDPSEVQRVLDFVEGMKSARKA